MKTNLNLLFILGNKKKLKIFYQNLIKLSNAIYYRKKIFWIMFLLNKCRFSNVSMEMILM